MATPTHARRNHHAVTEAALWLLWMAARWTAAARLAAALCRHGERLAAGLAAALVGTARHIRRAGRPMAASWTRMRIWWTRVRAAGHRAALRVELAAADLLTGPAATGLELAGTRLRRRAVWLIVVALLIANVVTLAAR